MCCVGGECCCSKLISMSASSQTLPACRGFMIKLASVMTSLSCAAIKCTRNLNITGWLPFSLSPFKSVSPLFTPFLPLTSSLPLALLPPSLSHLPLSTFFDLPPPPPPLPFCWGSILNFNWENLAIGAWCHREQLLTGEKRCSSYSANMCPFQ